MTRRIGSLLGAAAVGVLVLGALALALRDEPVDLEGAEAVGRPPGISPDYQGAVIPPNIAPLNFTVAEPGRRYCAEVRSGKGEPIRIVSQDGRIIIPEAAWRDLLAANAGGELFVDVYIQGRDDGRWRRFQRLRNTIAPEPIDRYLVYRLIRPLFNTWDAFGIWERDLSTFDERLLVSNLAFGKACVNCHTFLGNRGDTMMMHVRSRKYGTRSVVVRRGVGKRSQVLPPFGNPGYTSWHPSGELAVVAVVKVRQFFHTVRREVRDVIDLDSTLVCYLPEEDRFETHPSLSSKERLETYPCWDPKGEYLYFSSAAKLWGEPKAFPPERYKEVRYDLVRVRYEAASGRWGEPETVLSSEETGRSMTQPRISPDGRWLLFCMGEYGCFPIFDRSCDLHMMDLETRRYRRLDASSNEADTWHSWSSNGRWIVFSSKRGNGLFSRPHVSYVDAGGAVHKPIIMPQRDPTFYGRSIMTYNVPELVSGPVAVRGEALARLIAKKPATSPPDARTSASPPAQKPPGPISREKARAR